MIDFETFQLKNGLQVIIHPDRSVPLAVVNVLYNVGSRDEDPEKTGFAHLFEHLMFGGSVNIPSYDEPLQLVGGENNAFTNTDITNYYIQLPSANLETAFWLESDRMLGLAFSEQSLDVQKKVVVEEFKQRYLNQPYGDVWLKLRPAAYRVHPYQWPTIGKDITHIENATLEDVKSFFRKYYHPANAILSVAGDVLPSEIIKLAEKWFGPIDGQASYTRNLPVEPVQHSPRFLEEIARVPVDALYKVFHMPGRMDPFFHESDFISDILGNGKSSRLYQKLIKEKKIFNSLDVYLTGSDDPGLLVISGKMGEGISLETGNQEVEMALDEFRNLGPTPDELEKVKNQAEAGFSFNEVELLNKAMSLAYFSNLGDPALYNLEPDKIRGITLEGVRETARKVLNPDNGTTLFYRAANGQP
jgi:predicted Zn-dependent peptidase